MRSRPLRRRGWALLPVIAVIFLLVLLWWQRAFVLAPAGNFLDVGEAPQRAEVAIVLAGGWRGERVMKAGQLVAAGYAPYILLSGPSQFYGQPECALEIPYGVSLGFPKEYFQCAPNNAENTREEARALFAELERRGVRKCLIVSSDTHLRRARRIFRATAPAGMEMHFMSAPSPHFRLARWWEAREGRKAILLEWLKIVTGELEI